MLILAVTLAMAQVAPAAPTTPDEANLSVDAIATAWRKCVTDYAKQWSTLSDTAESIADAAVSKCSGFENILITKMGRAPLNLPYDDAQKSVASMHPVLRGKALVAIMEARSARISPKREAH